MVAIFLAAIGAYGVLAHAMSRRIREIGARLAFGATSRHVFGLLFGHGMRLTLIGTAIGIPIAIGATRFLSALLFGVDAAEPAIFAVVAVVLLLSASAYRTCRPAERRGSIQWRRCGMNDWARFALVGRGPCGPREAGPACRWGARLRRA